jgi:hypothetical protein
MPSKPPVPIRQRAQLRAEDLPDALAKLKRRLAEVEAAVPRNEEQLSSMAISITTKVNQTYDEVFGENTVEAEGGHIKARDFSVMFFPSTLAEKQRGFESKRQRVVALLKSNIEVLQERASEEPIGTAGTLRAYQGLDLHPEIARAAASWPYAIRSGAG